MLILDRVDGQTHRMSDRQIMRLMSGRGEHAVKRTVISPFDLFVLIVPRAPGRLVVAEESEHGSSAVGAEHKGNVGRQIGDDGAGGDGDASTIHAPPPPRGQLAERAHAGQRAALAEE